MQNLAPALEQILISRVLNERVLEAIIGVRRQALHQQDVGLGKPFQRCLQRRILHPGHGAQKRIREVASDHGADLRHLARWAEPVEPRRQRLLQCRRDRLDAALLAALQQEPRHFLDEQRHAAGALGHAIDHFLRQRVAGGKLADHVPHLMAVERRERNRAVMRAHAPGRPELRPGSDENEQGRQRAAFGDAAQHIERGRIGPVHIFNRQHHRLSPRAGHHPIGQRRQLPAPQFLRRQSRCALRRQRNVQ